MKGQQQQADDEAGKEIITQGHKSRMEGFLLQKSSIAFRSLVQFFQEEKGNIGALTLTSKAKEEEMKGHFFVMQNTLMENIYSAFWET